MNKMWHSGNASIPAGDPRSLSGLLARCGNLDDLVLSDDKDEIVDRWGIDAAACEAAKGGQNCLMGAKDEARKAQSGAVPVAQGDVGVEMTGECVAFGAWLWLG
jgi:hypothetical protein